MNDGVKRYEPDTVMEESDEGRFVKLSDEVLPTVTVGNLCTEEVARLVLAARGFGVFAQTPSMTFDSIRYNEAVRALLDAAVAAARAMGGKP